MHHKCACFHENSYALLKNYVRERNLLIVANRLFSRKITQKSSNWCQFDGKISTIRTIRNTRTIRVFFQKVFYIRTSTIPTRTGNPTHNSKSIEYLYPGHFKILFYT